MTFQSYINDYNTPYNHYVRVVIQMIESEAPEAFFVIMANKLGMIIPSDESAQDYVRNNLRYLKQCINRLGKPVNPRESLNLLTDREIYDTFQVYTRGPNIPYQSLEMIFTNFGSRFFIPYFRHPQNSHYVVTGEDTKDLTYFSIAYGTLNNYNMYLLRELIWAISSYEEIGTRSFKLPISANHREGTVIVENKFRDLQRILHEVIVNPSFMGRDPEIKDRVEDAKNLFDEIDKTSKFIEHINTSDFGILQKYKLFSRDDSNMLLEILKQTFLLGMYFRQWEGPGNKFPHLDVETRCISGFDPDLSTLTPRSNLVTLYTTASQEVKDILDFMPVIEHIEGKEIKHNMNLGYFLRWILLIDYNPDRQKYCIRMGSTLMIGSAFYYTKLLTNVSLGSNGSEQYNPLRIQKIA